MSICFTNTCTPRCDQTVTITDLRNNAGKPFTPFSPVTIAVPGDGASHCMPVTRFASTSSAAFIDITYSVTDCHGNTRTGLKGRVPAPPNYCRDAAPASATASSSSSTTSTSGSAPADAKAAAQSVPASTTAPQSTSAPQATSGTGAAPATQSAPTGTAPASAPTQP